MMFTTHFSPRFVIAAASVACLMAAFCLEPSRGETPAASEAEAKKAPVIDEKDRVSVEVARDRAKLMHDIYSATLDTIHHRYFHREKAVIPARAMEDVFSEMKLQNKSEARWIAINLRAMSIDHEPETEFEKHAARELTAGKGEVEQIEGGYFRRIAPIPLTEGCISCHEGSFRQPTKNPKFAGLVISIPVLEPAAPAAPPAESTAVK